MAGSFDSKLGTKALISLLLVSSLPPTWAARAPAQSTCSGPGVSWVDTTGGKGTRVLLRRVEEAYCDSSAVSGLFAGQVFSTGQRPAAPGQDLTLPIRVPRPLASVLPEGSGGQRVTLLLDGDVPGRAGKVTFETCAEFIGG